MFLNVSMTSSILSWITENYITRKLKLWSKPNGITLSFYNNKLYKNIRKRKKKANKGFVKHDFNFFFFLFKTRKLRTRKEHFNASKPKKKKDLNIDCKAFSSVDVLIKKKSYTTSIKRLKEKSLLLSSHVLFI